MQWEFYVKESSSTIVNLEEEAQTTLGRWSSTILKLEVEQYSTFKSGHYLIVHFCTNKSGLEVEYVIIVVSALNIEKSSTPELQEVGYSSICRG